MQIEIPDLQLEDLVLEQNAEAVYKIALESMPEIKSAVLKMESANLALKANRGSYLPRLSLTGLASSNFSSVSNAAAISRMVRFSRHLAHRGNRWKSTGVRLSGQPGSNCP